MKLNKTWKIIIGIFTAFMSMMPIFFFIGIMVFMMSSIGFVDNSRNEPPTALIYLMLFGFFAQFFWIFLRLGLIAFYQVHVILNDTGSKTFRILLSLGNFFVPYISMPIYYFIYIFPDEIPNWALEQPAPAVEEVVEEVTKPSE